MIINTYIRAGKETKEVKIKITETDSDKLEAIRRLQKSWQNMKIPHKVAISFLRRENIKHNVL